MQFARMTSIAQESLLAELAAMPAFLATSLGAVSAEEAIRRGPDDTFAPVEQCWHLAELERDGFAVRIRRLLVETAPELADFDGARAAEEGQYVKRSLAGGLAAFQVARQATLEQLRAIAPHEWSRTGSQPGVGAVALCDIPQMIAAHDAAHRQEIEAWMRDRFSARR